MSISSTTLKKNQHETEEMWRLRRTFIECYSNCPEFSAVDPDRPNNLICLAQILVNIEFLGCSYDQMLMSKVLGMAEKIGLRRQHHFGEATAAGSHLPHSPSTSGLNVTKKNDRFFEKFVIFQREGDRLPKNTLNVSCGFNRIILAYDESTTDDGKFKYDVRIGEKVLSSGFGASKLEAKDSAANSALELLQQKCFTIVLKSSIDPDQSQVNVSERKDASSQAARKHLQSGFGAKLMARMGWSGGGIGKNEQGRKEPIQILERFARHGLGSLVTDRHFNKIVRSIIEEYAKSDNEDDLVFAANLSNEQRKYIHNLAGRYKLKHVSYGHGDSRQLTLQKRRTGVELLDYLLSVGGENGKYKVIPPPHLSPNPV